MRAQSKSVNCKVMSSWAFVITQIQHLHVCAFVQLDNPDEQAAQIRRELDGRLQMADQIARVRKPGAFAGGPGLSPTRGAH